MTRFEMPEGVTRTHFLLLVVLVAGAGCRKHAPAPAGPRPKLEIVLVDDALDPLLGMDESTLPRGARIDEEYVPVGPGANIPVHYARIVAARTETVDGAVARLGAALHKVTVPPDHRFAFAPIFDGASPGPVAARSYLLMGPAVLRETDVTAADALRGESGEWSVAVTLSATGAKTFEEATRRNIDKRIAIVVDDRVMSAPVVKSAIGGGHVQITMGRVGDPGEQQRDAELLARGLGGR